MSRKNTQHRKVRPTIWIFNQYAGAPKNSSGKGERFYFLSQEFIKYNCDSYIFASKNNPYFLVKPEFKGLTKLEKIDNVQFVWVNSTKYSNTKSLKRIYSWIDFTIKLFFIDKKEIPHPDIIITSSFPFFPMLYALWLKTKYQNIKLILELRDIWPETLIQLGGYSKFNPFVVLLSIIEKFLYRKADYIVSVLPFANKYIQSKINQKPKFKWIPNGITFYNNKGNSDTLEKIQGIKNKLVIGYAGALGIANAMDQFVASIELLNSNRSFHFLIIGDGPQREEYLQHCEGNSNVTFINKVPKEEVHDYLQKCDVLFIGWKNKDFYKYGVSANKYNDYMLASKPILSVGELGFDPVKEADCGISLKTNNVESIISGLEKFNEMSKSERKILGKNGYNYLIHNNLYSNLAKQYLEVFDELSKQV